MISLHHLLTNPDVYTKELEKRFKDTSVVPKIIELEEIYRPKLTDLESLRRRKNEFNKHIFSLQGEQKIEAIKEMKSVSDSIKSLEVEIKEVKELQTQLLYKVPNLTWEGIPVGQDDTQNKVLAFYNDKPQYTFEPKHYYDLEVFKRDYKSKKGVEAAGFRGYYISGELARLQKVLFEWVLERLIDKGFEYIIPPVMVNENLLYGTGFFPDGIDDTYVVSKGEKELYLPGTSEAALMFLHSNSKLDLTIQSKRLTAQTRCFRAESGSYGKDTKGGFRVHEFEKIETVVICRPSQSEELFNEITQNFHEVLDELGIHYQDLEVCTGDISIKNYRQIDIEAYFPAQESYRELCSSSNCTDYQTRNLNIKTYEDGEEVLAHSLNCTGITNRTLLCILEQFQNEDGSVLIPSVLVDKFGKSVLS